MKRLAIITASLLMVFQGLNMSAQTSKYGHGEDSLNCLKYLSFYTERFKKDEKDPMALSNWRQAYKYCPATASENIFINGTKMMTNLYRNTKNAKQRVAIADTILMLQDQRLAAYPKKKATILNNKGQYIINYKSSDVDFMYENLSGIMNELGKNTKSNILSALMQSAVAQYREEKLSADDIPGRGQGEDRVHLCSQQGCFLREPHRHLLAPLRVRPRKPRPGVQDHPAHEQCR